MTEKTRHKQIDAILLTMALYYHLELEPAIVKLYYELLAAYEVTAIGAACKAWMKTNRWFPKANELIEIIEQQQNPQVSIEALSQQQWRFVMTAVRKRGINHPPSFSDPVTANLIKTQFRWSYLCSMDETKENWEQKRFCDAYEQAAELHPDLVCLEAGTRIKALADTVGVHTNRLPDETAAVVERPVTAEAIAAYKARLQDKIVQDPDDHGAARLKQLQQQARRLAE